MRINPLVAGVIILVVAATSMALIAQELQDGKQEVKASPRSSHDFPTRPIAPHHSKPVKVEDGRTLLWAEGDPEGEENAIWFDMTDALVNPRDFQFGIGKDRIPSIDKPVFVSYRDLGNTETRITDQTVRARAADEVPNGLVDFLGILALGRGRSFGHQGDSGQGGHGGGISSAVGVPMPQVGLPPGQPVERVRNDAIVPFLVVIFCRLGGGLMSPRNQTKNQRQRGEFHPHRFHPHFFSTGFLWNPARPGRRL